MCEIGNTFSKVVICRRFCPAGGQPFFQAFLRLPDHNPLKRLEAFFRVISSWRRRGALHPMGPASFYSTRCKTSLAALVLSLSLSCFRNSNRNRSLRESPRAEHPWRRLCKGGLIHPFFSFFVTILHFCPPPCFRENPPHVVLFLNSLALSLFFSFVIFVPSTR